MTVFKGCMKILKKNIGLFMIYIGIFAIFSAVNMGNKDGKKADEFQMESIKMAVIDQDESKLSQGIIDFLKLTNQVSMMEDDEAMIQDRLFNRDVVYIVKIPENFQEMFMTSDVELSIIKVPDLASGFNADQRINNFLNQVKVYMSAGYTVEEALGAVNDLPDGEHVQMLTAADKTALNKVDRFFQMAPFVVLCIICFGLGSVYSVLSKEDVKKRTIASAVSTNRRNMEMLLASVFVGLAIFGIVLLLGAVLLKDAMFGNPLIGYYIGSLFCCMLCSLSIAYLLSLFGKDQEALSGLTNAVTLGMSFLCGVFVPLEFINKNVKNVSQFFPLYWYEHANSLMKGMDSLSESLRNQVLKDMGIQVLFAAAIIVVAFVIANRRKAA